jgi:hypothetical protein
MDFLSDRDRPTIRPPIDLLYPMNRSPPTPNLGRQSDSLASSAGCLETPPALQAGPAKSASAIHGIRFFEP